MRNQQTQRRFEAGIFGAVVHGLPMPLCELNERAPHPRAAIVDSRMLQSTPESEEPAGYDGAKRKKGSKVQMAVETFGHLLDLLMAPVDQQDRARATALAKKMQRVTVERVEVAFVDADSSGLKG
jgi:hypothetical protein